MSEPTNPPAPAEQAVEQASTSALQQEQIAPTFFIPQATRDNYAQIARDQAAVRGTEPRQVMQELAEQWAKLHEQQPLDGYDHLAAWGRDYDPAEGQGPSGLAVLQARALESARRDPYQAVIGDQALVEQAVAAQQTADERALSTSIAPSVDPSSGLLPNSGPLPVPDDVATGPDVDSGSEPPSSSGSGESTSPTVSAEQTTADPSAPDAPAPVSSSDAPSTSSTSSRRTSSSGSTGDASGS